MRADEPVESMHRIPAGSSEDISVSALVERILTGLKSRPRVPLILAGSIGAGKTQTALAVAQRLHQLGIRIGGVLAPRRIDRGRTIGYSLLDLRSGEDRPFARMNPPGHPVGRFFVDEDAVAFAADAIRRSAAEDDVVFLDEIGRWELRGGGHAPALRDLLAGNALPVLLVRSSLVDDAVSRFTLRRHELFRLDNAEAEEIDAFWALVDSIEYPLFVTHGGDGYPESRPMHLLERDDSELWFATSRRSRKVRQIAEHSQVTVLFVDTHRFDYASLHGVAAVVDNADRARRLWREEWSDDWPNGPTDPDYTLLRVRGRRGFYMRGASGRSSEVVLAGDEPE